MNSFFSGTDDANENMTQFYAVWGKVTSDEPQFSFRYVVGDTKEECDPSILIDWPTLERKRTVTTEESIRLDGDLSLLDIQLKSNEFTQTKEPTVEDFESELVKGPFVYVSYPEDWMHQHTKKVYTRKKHSGKNFYQNYKQGQIYGNAGQTSLNLGSEDDSYGYAYGQDELYAEYLEDYYSYEEASLDEDEDLVMYSHTGEKPSETLAIFLEEVVFDLVEDNKTIKKFIY